MNSQKCEDFFALILNNTSHKYKILWSEIYHQKVQAVLGLYLKALEVKGLIPEYVFMQDVHVLLNHFTCPL